MKLNRTKNELDREARNNENNNWEKLENKFNNVVSEISGEVFDQIVDGSKIDWEQMVDTFNDLPSSAETGETRGVKEDNKIYRYDGSNWVPIAEINLNPIAEVDDRLSSQLAQTMKKIAHVVNVSDFGVVNTSTTDDQTEGIQSAIDYVSSLGGGEVQFNNATYYAQGIAPKSNVTLKGTGRSRLKLAKNATNHLIYYNDPSTLEHFNLIDLEIDGENSDYDLIHITEPDPGAPAKTWYMSIVDNCVIKNGNIGIYCPVPGSVKIINSYIAFNDIGIKQEQEHYYLTNTVVWGNRIGADIDRANHFTWYNAVFAHNTEVGVQATSIVRPTGDSAFENAYIGCVFIDNGEFSMKGRYERSRIIACRFLQSENAIEALLHASVVSDCYFNDINAVAIGLSGKESLPGDATIKGNVFRLCGTALETKNKYFRGTLSGNTFLSNNFAIRLTGSDVVVTGNYFKQSLYESIVIAPSDNDGGFGINISSNHFRDGGRSTSRSDVAHILIDNSLKASLISNNTFREGTNPRSAHAIKCVSGTSYFDALITNNVSRGMIAEDYVLDDNITESTNIGTVISA